MKKNFFYILIFSIVLLFVGSSLVKSQNPSAPQPIMQSSPLINQDIESSNSSAAQNNKICPTNDCPPPIRPKPGQNTGFNNMPPIGNNQPPQIRQVQPTGQQHPSSMQEGPQNVLIILDASYSMEEKIGRDRKIDIAKRVVHNTVQQIPQGTRVGLRVYGHKIGLMGIYPCRKTELLVPIDFNTSGPIIERLRNINPTGQTPITYSIKTAVMNDFNGLNGPKRIILVSDGMETCDGNPCDYAVEMVRRGIDLKVDVVGFALKDPAAINQLKCVALSTGGKFYTADTEAALARSLQNSFAVKTEVQGKIIFK